MCRRGNNKRDTKKKTEKKQMIIWSCTIVLSFFVYSFLGWLWESTVCSLYNEKQLINRGFLVGPLCPIYGAGALCCYFALYHVQNPVAVFVLSALLCCALEYLVSYTMEKIFHTRWWDYSDFPFIKWAGFVCTVRWHLELGAFP